MSQSWYEPLELIGRTLRLTPLLPGDAAELLAALGETDDAEHVLAHLSYSPPRDVDEARQIIGSLLGHEDRVVYGQRLRLSDELIGTTSFYDIDPHLRSLAIGHTWIARRYWRTGVNTESKLLMLTRAFEELGAERVVWHTDIRNERSQTAISRLGATKEGVLRHHRLRRDGSWRDTVLFSMLSSEWPAAKERLLSAGGPDLRGASRADSDQTQVHVQHNPTASRYEATLANELVGVVDYRLDGDTMTVLHTGTKPRFRGRGVAGRLTTAVLDDARARGQAVRPVCPYTASFIRDHPEYRDLLV